MSATRWPPPATTTRWPDSTDTRWPPPADDTTSDTTQPFGLLLLATTRTQ